MKILVLSDSHERLNFMRMCIAKIKPDYLIHLGDYVDDGKIIALENPDIPFSQVPGNCDCFRDMPLLSDILIRRIGGVTLYMTHGHRHGVKTKLDLLLRDAKENHVDAVLYGHTHIPNCYQEADGMWVLNPGTCSSPQGTVGLMTVEHHKIVDCRILWKENLEEFT